MEPSKKLSASSRVKACTECRQHKLRCDAAKDRSVPCSRCRRRGLHCEITTAFRRTKRRTKKELQAELESLQEQVESQGSTITPLTYTNESSTPGQDNMSIGPSSAGAVRSNPSVPTPASLPPTSVQFTDPELERLSTTSATATSARTIAGQEISSKTIDSCFDLFQQRYLRHFPTFIGKYRPNTAYLQSEFLFWTIVAVGARKYVEDPTLLTMLQPQIVDLASRAILSRENPVPTIKALIILCTWPLPHDSLNKDISPMLAGALLQHALNIGLHIYGVGQDFSRTKVPVDRAQIQYRKRLWLICITVCQRVSCTTGTPPPLVADTYNRSPKEKEDDSPFAASLAFEKALSATQTEAIIQLERTSLATPPRLRASVLNPLIDTSSEQLLELLPQAPDEIGKFYLHAAQLQVLCFHLFIPKESLEDAKLQRLYELACLCIEATQAIETSNGLSDCAPVFISKYLDMAAFTILKISRSHLSQSLDLDRGRRAYFFVINFCRSVSVQSGDVMDRSAGILTQLWASKNIFKRSDGSYDSLSLRCGSRLAMSVFYDCLWWWRSEFGGQADPYEETQSQGRSRSPVPGAEDDTTVSSANMQPPEQIQQPMISPALDSFETPTALDLIFPESQWAAPQDLMSLDWSQFQYDLMPFVDMQHDPALFEPPAMFMPDVAGFQPSILQGT